MQTALLIRAKSERIEDDDKPLECASKPISQFAALKSVVYPSDPCGEAADTDILDVALVEFRDDVGPAFFTDPAYILEENTVGMSEEGDVLLVNGSLKEKSELSGTSVTPTFCLLEFADWGASRADLSLRQAQAVFKDPEFSTITGLSGSPVFNASNNRLAGMVVRGTLNGRVCTIWYVDIFDLLCSYWPPLPRGVPGQIT